MLKIVGPNWSNELTAFLKKASREVFIVVPYFSRNVIETNLAIIKSKVRIRALLGFESRDVLSGASDYIALTKLVQRAEVRHLRRVHAKVYMRDSEEVIVTSANLTNSGLESNLELGLKTNDRAVIAELETLLQPYWEDAYPITEESLLTAKEFDRLRLKYAEEHAEQEYRQMIDEGYLIELRRIFEKAPIARNVIKESEKHSFLAADRTKIIREHMPSNHEIETRDLLLEYLKEVLTPDQIEDITKDECKEVLCELQSRFGAIHRLNIDTILSNPIKRIRRSLMHLFWGDDDDLSRLNDILNEKVWQLQGVGIGVLSALLMVKDPERYPLYNEKVRKGLMKIIPEETFGKQPEDYLRFAEIIIKLRKSHSIPTTAMDLILWRLSKK